MKKNLNICLSILLVILVLSCSSQSKIRAGSICTVENGDEKFGIVKVLVIEKEIIHVKIYKNIYNKRPSKVNTEKLTTGSMYDKDGFGVNHTPLDKNTFFNWKPIEVAFDTIKKDDLVGYEMWKKNQ